MKSRIFFITALFFSLNIFIQCKKTISNGLGKAVSTMANGEVEEAGQIIDTYNNFLAVDKARAADLDKALEYGVRVYDYMAGETPILTASMFGIGMRKDLEKVPDVFDNQADLQAMFDKLDSSYASIKSDMESLDLYIKAEDFKDDQGVKAEEIIENIDKNAEIYYQNSDKIYEILKPLVDDAEKITLKDDPLKDQIIQMKSVMNEMLASLDEVDNQYISLKYDANKWENYATSINTEIVELEKIGFEPKDINFKGKTSYFNSFLKETKNFQAEFKKLQRNAAEKSAINEQDYDDVERSYNNLINQYNYFIN